MARPRDTPDLTDVVLGTWTSATLLDLVEAATPPPRPRGWSASDCSPPDRHSGPDGQSGRQPGHATNGWASFAVTNGVALSAFTRRLGLPAGGDGTAPGPSFALAGAAVSSVGAYLGGHLVEARKVASRHPAYDAALQA